MKILFLAGGFDQIAFIKELKRRGNIIFLADYTNQPLAEKYADSFLRISTLDVEAVEKIAKKLSVFDLK